MSIKIISDGTCLTQEDFALTEKFVDKYVKAYDSGKYKMYKINESELRVFYRPLTPDKYDRIYFVGFGYYTNWHRDVMIKYLNDEIDHEQIMYYSGDIGCFSIENLEPIGKKAIKYQLCDAEKRNNKKDIKKYIKLFNNCGSLFNLTKLFEGS